MVCGVGIIADIGNRRAGEGGVRIGGGVSGCGTGGCGDGGRGFAALATAVVKAVLALMRDGQNVGIDIGAFCRKRLLVVWHNRLLSYRIASQATSAVPVLSFWHDVAGIPKESRRRPMQHLVVVSLVFLSAVPAQSAKCGPDGVPAGPDELK
eukprot:824347-Pleurochrysis_carterae.AAC.1